MKFQVEITIKEQACPLTGKPCPRESEIVTVTAGDRWKAQTAAMRDTALSPRGRFVTFTVTSL